MIVCKYLLALLGCCQILVFSTDSRAANVRVVALTGQPATGTPASTFTNFSLPVLDNAGRVAFHGAANNVPGVWSEGSGALSLLALRGMQAPGTPSGVTFDSFGSQSFPMVTYENGKTVLRASLTGPGVTTTNAQGIWSNGSGALALIVRTGNQAPGTPVGVTFSDLVTQFFPNFSIPPRFNAAGQTAFSAALAGSGVNSSNDEGIWSDRSGSLALVARAGDAAPGTAAGVAFSVFQVPVFNDAGQIAFLATLNGGDVTTINRGIWSEDTGPLALVAREGSQAPGAAPGENFVRLLEPVINSTGQIAFRGIFSSGGNNMDGIWSGGTGSLGMVAREGMQAPGTASGVQFNLLNAPILNAAGDVTFYATLQGGGSTSSDDSGIWIQASEGLQLVAREGSRAPGTPDGVVFGASFVVPAMNAKGQVAFNGQVVGSGINFMNERGIWATTVSGQLELVVRQGDAFEVAPSDFRTISSVSFYSGTANEDGQQSAFNDRGEIAFFARFTDGSQGVFVTDAVAVPEPCTFLTCALVLLGLISGRARRRNSAVGI